MATRVLVSWDFPEQGWDRVREQESIIDALMERVGATWEGAGTGFGRRDMDFVVDDDQAAEDAVTEILALSGFSELEAWTDPVDDA